MTTPTPTTEQLLTLQRKLATPDWRREHGTGDYIILTAEELRIVSGLVALRVDEVGGGDERKHERV